MGSFNRFWGRSDQTPSNSRPQEDFPEALEAHTEAQLGVLRFLWEVSRDQFKVGGRIALGQFLYGMTLLQYKAVLPGIRTFLHAGSEILVVVRTIGEQYHTQFRSPDSFDDDPCLFE
ncbi:hypothetical protein KC622_00290 [Candidatus Dojkabacteria bacterium]|uniref:Uncharacterized protein n=1 Tax=Candidatus Dojkabacteria bacterium TaxID=2099670 RepID=A0A955KVC5_9BACT|nr:hypothetical protein [Candidatus Dojkabacteria bacterium]